MAEKDIVVKADDWIAAKGNDLQAYTDTVVALLVDMKAEIDRQRRANYEARLALIEGDKVKARNILYEAYPDQPIKPPREFAGRPEDEN